MALLLTRADVEAALPMAECIASQEHAFREHGLGTAQTPHRLGLKVPEQDGLYIAMPAYLQNIPLSDQDQIGAMAVKVLTFYPSNPARLGRPAIVATVLLHDPHTGTLLAIMDEPRLQAYAPLPAAPWPPNIWRERMLRQWGF